MIRALMIAVATVAAALVAKPGYSQNSDFAGKGDDKAWISAVNAEL